MRAVARVYLVRHGQTDWNRDRRLQGHADPPLNAAGRAQAVDLAEGLAAELGGLRDKPLLFASDLRRALETADPVADVLDRAPRRLRLLRERAFGPCEGKTWDELRAEHPEAVAAYKAHVDRDALPGSEPFAAFEARVLAGVAKCARRADGLELGAVVVTHGGVIRVLLAAAHGAGKRFMVANGAVFRLDVDDAGVRPAPRPEAPA